LGRRKRGGEAWDGRDLGGREGFISPHNKLQSNAAKKKNIWRANTCARPMASCHVDTFRKKLSPVSNPRIQYSDRALERLLARDVPSADVTAKDAAVCQSAPTTHPHNVPGILVSPSSFSFLYIP